MAKKASLLGSYEPIFPRFKNLDKLFKEFTTDTFLNKPEREKFHLINHRLSHLITSHPKPCFLLPAVLEFISNVNEKQLLLEKFTINRFEHWLNHFSRFSEEINHSIRAAIVGKNIPRSSYQHFYPIGMKKQYDGPHFVASHKSPDIDTTISSFWGWLDAFACQVGTGLHIWNVPGGPPCSFATNLFKKYLGDQCFDLLSRKTDTLSVSAMEILSPKNLIKAPSHSLTSMFDINEFPSQTLILVDDHGCYLGDWKLIHLEQVRQILMLFYSTIRWFEKTVLASLVSIYSAQKINAQSISQQLQEPFNTMIKECEPAQDYTEQQFEKLDHVLKKILFVPQGIDSTFGELLSWIDPISKTLFSKFKDSIKSLTSLKFFDKKNCFIENRPDLFKQIDLALTSLSEGISHVRNFLDQGDTYLAISSQILNIPNHFVTPRSDLDEIRAKIANYNHVTVAIPETNGKWFPIGIVRKSTLDKPILGTVSLRDFCNEEEINISDYLEVISVIDHHKATLKTSHAPTVISGDAQSSNVLVAEKWFQINDQYSLGGLSKKEIQDYKFKPNKKSSDIRLNHKMIKRSHAAIQDHYYIDPSREYMEYLFFLYAIIDDTDLLNKVTIRDLECTREILNRLKSIAAGEEVEIISFDDLQHDESFIKKATQRILQNNDMYSIYSKIYSHRNELNEEQILEATKKSEGTFFADTKMQNGTTIVGQTKLFASNIPSMQDAKMKIIKQWLKRLDKVCLKSPEFQLFQHIVSTIPGELEVYEGNIPEHTHRDELWLACSDTEKGSDYLTSFLSTFGHNPTVKANQHEFACYTYGKNAAHLEEIIHRNFLSVPLERVKSTGPTFAVISFKPGLLNSRKGMITPYLPKKN